MTKEKGLALFGLFISVALIVCTFLFTRTLRQTIPSNQIVKVRGVAERSIDSDRVDWTLEIAYVEENLELAYQKVEEATEHLLKYFSKQGINKDQVTFGNYLQETLIQKVFLDELGNYETKVNGYEVRLKVSLLEFRELDLVEKLSKSIGSELQKRGWLIKPRRPYFYFSKNIDDLKPALLKEAAKNAYERATIVAESSGSSIDALKAARQGAFSGFDEKGLVGGFNRSHQVSAVVTVDFSIKK